MKQKAPLQGETKKKSQTSNDAKLKRKLRYLEFVANFTFDFELSGSFI